MVLERPFALFIFPACFLAGAFVLASLQITPSYDFSSGSSKLIELAQITKNDGRIDMSRFHTYHSSRMRKGSKLDIPVYHLDKIIVQARSKTQLEFLDGYRIEFLPYSRFVLEKWDSENNTGPIYINLLNGSYRILKKGRVGSVYIVKDNKIFTPEQKPKKGPRKLFVIRSQYQPAGSIAAQSIEDKDQTLESSVNAEPEELPESTELTETADAKGTETQASEDQKIKQAESKGYKDKPSSTILSTLSNEYIDDVIARNKDQLQKCQSYAVREKKNAKGQLVIGFSIAPRGKMEQVAVIQSSIKNPELEECVADVFERTKFKAFEGNQIVRSYPLIFD